MYLNPGINNPTAAAISISPVKYIVSVLNGTKSGSIIDIPLVNAKWPTAVKTSMAAIAILPASGIFVTSLINFIAAMDITKTVNNTIRDFIESFFDKGQKILFSAQ